MHTAFPRDLAAGRYLDLFVVGGVVAPDETVWTNRVLRE